MKFWIVKCRQHLPDREGWSWDSYFDGSDHDYRTDDVWGGPDWIKSNHSKMFIREEVRKGDLIICYQFEGKRICGFTVMAGDGREVPAGSGDYNQLYIAAARKALMIEPEFTVDQLRSTGCFPKWLRRGQGTVFPLSQREFDGILRAIRIHCPGMDDRLARWLKRVGLESAERRTDAAAPPTTPKPHGGGFSTDPTKNAMVEKAAVRLVKKTLRADGWKIKDVQSDCVGFDLRCTKGKTERLDVEVKGIAGTLESFPVTYGEVHQAEENQCFVIWVVTEALSPIPNIHKYSGKKFLATFNLKAIQYMARR